MELAGEARPRLEQLQRAAWVVGQRLAQSAIEGGDTDLSAQVETVLRETLSRDLAAALSPKLAAAMADVARTMCGACAVRCIDQPDRGVNDVYFAPECHAPPSRIAQMPAKRIAT